MSKKKKVVPDTSVLIDGILGDKIEEGKLKDIEVVIPSFVLEELRAQASKGREIGFKGMEELGRLRKFSKDGVINFNITGRRQTLEEIKLAKSGRVDALIIDVAKEKNAVLYTSDRVQALNAEIENVKTEYFEPYEKESITRLEKMLTKNTMSLHLKENTYPMAKVGKPGSFELSKIRDEKLSKKNMEEIINEIMDAARYEEDSFIEFGGRKASVVQLGNIRVSIARPPFSEGLEVTAVRPIAKVGIDDYKMAEKLKNRLSEKAEGVLVAGPPGSGKSTFASALAEFYKDKGKVVKTMESPRDLQVSEEITQYTKLKGSYENTSDLLLLVRPDYTIFDEVRKTEEFNVFSDMRLAGVGMIGVVHATEAVDAVARFINRLELGTIPHVIDTIIYIKAGKIDCVYYLKSVVKTPTGMTEADLARPVVEVRDFETNELKYEIYTYGEENVIMAVEEEKTNAVHDLAKKEIVKKIRPYDKNPHIKINGKNRVTVKVDNEAIPRLIGKQGKNINKIEKKLDIHIDILPKASVSGKKVDFDLNETGSNLVFDFDASLSGQSVDFYVDNACITSAIVSKNGQVKITKKSKIGKELVKGLIKNKVKTFI